MYASRKRSVVFGGILSCLWFLCGVEVVKAVGTGAYVQNSSATNLTMRTGVLMNNGAYSYGSYYVMTPGASTTLPQVAVNAEQYKVFAEAASGSKSEMKAIDCSSGGDYWNCTRISMNGSDYGTTIVTNKRCNILFTNTTGAGISARYVNGCTYEVLAVTYIGTSVRIDKLFTNSVSGCSEFECPVLAYWDDTLQDYVVLSEANASQFVTVGSAAGSGGNSVTGSGTATGGTVANPTGTATNIAAGPVTNLVSWWSPTNIANYGSSGAATGQDIMRAADAIIRAEQDNANKLLGGLKAIQNAVEAGSTNGTSGGTGTNEIDYRPDWGRATNLLQALLASDTNVVGKAALLSQYATNQLGSFDSAGVDTTARSAVSSLFTSVSNTGASLGNAALPTVTSGRPTMTIAFFGSTIDLDPLSDTDFADKVTVFRSITVWALAGLLLMAAWRVTEDYMKAGAQVRQATTAGTSFMGFNVNTGSALTMATLITTALLAIPAVGMAYISFAGISSTFVASNFTAGFGSWWGYANNFLPVDMMVGTAMSYLAFRFAFGTVFAVVSTVIRYMVGL